jgi:arabinofuranosyltransferase
MHRIIFNLSNFCLIAITAIPLIYIAWLLNGSLLGIDDTDIFLTYAENLANGKGIIYSKTIPPVEGYSSMLWMMLLSLIFYIGHGEMGIFFLTCLLFLVTQFIALKIIDFFIPQNGSFIKLLYVLLTFTSFGYISWSTITLMDVTVWGLIVILLTYNFVKEPKGTVGWIVFCLPFALAPITRPEAFLVVPGFLFLYSFYRILGGLSKKPIIVGTALFVSSLIFVTSFRYIYFGYFLPNTYYAKISPSLAYNLEEGIFYFYQFLINSPVASMSILGSIIFIIYFLYNFSRGKSVTANSLSYFHLIYICIFLSLLLITPILKGGDHFRLFRFYQPYYPLLAICMILTWRSLCLVVIKKNLATSIIVVSLVVSVIIYSFSVYIFGPQGWVKAYKNKSPIAHEFQISRMGRVLGEHLNLYFQDVTNNLPAIGVITAGGIARKYGGPIYDLMGLNNSFIAHFPGDRRGIKNHAAFEKDAFFYLPISILVATPDNDFVQIALKGLFQDPRFVSEWRFGTLTYKDLKGNQLLQNFFFKDNFLQSMLLQKNFLFVDTAVFDQTNNKWKSIGTN